MPKSPPRARRAANTGPIPLDTLLNDRAQRGVLGASTEGARRRTWVLRTEDGGEDLEATLRAAGGHRIFADPADDTERHAATTAHAAAGAAPDPDAAARAAADHAARRAKYAALYPPVDVDGPAARARG